MADAPARSPTCSAREWCFVLAFSALALAITSIPYALGAAMATESRVFGGFLYAVEDCYSYLAKMRQGAAGAWLFHIAYTPEPHPGALFVPFHLLLGKVAALVPGGDLTAHMVWVYHTARVVCGLVLLLAVYRFLAEFTGQVAVRRLAWLMVTLGGGLGWLLIALGQPNWLGSPPLDLYLPEGFAFLALYGFPHIAAAQSLLLAGLLLLLRAWNSGYGTRNTQHAARFTFHVPRPYRSVSLAGLAWLLMGLIVPFYVPVAWAVTGAAWLALGLRQRRLPWREGLLAGGAALVAAPIVVYSGWMFATNPVYATWAAQNQILSPHPLHYLAAYGAPLVLAGLAARHAWREEKMGWLLLAWVGLAPVLAYLPFSLQRRLVAGVQVPLSLLAAMGAMPSRHLAQRCLAIALLATMLPTSLFLVASSSAWMFDTPPPAFREAAEVAALDWLSGQVQAEDVVLAAYDTGSYLPVRVVARVFLGHGLETVDAQEKEALLAHFFDGATDDARRQHLLAQYGVDYVFWGPAERALGGFDAGHVPYLKPLYSAGGTTVFEVR